MHAFHYRSIPLPDILSHDMTQFIEVLTRHELSLFGNS